MRWVRMWALVWSALAPLAAPSAFAQQQFGPGEERPGLESFAPEAPSEPLELPPVPEAPEEEALSAGLRVFVREFVIEGSRVFSSEELAEITAPYRGRTITSEELLAVREAITAHYVQNGYITSGAVIPDQTVEDGVVRIEIVEGALSDVLVEGTHWFRPRYFRDRLLRAGRAPVSVVRLERELQIFQQDPRVRRVSARLEPGATRGESVLNLDVKEGRPYSLSLGAANHHNPAIGGEGGVFQASLANLVGHADELTGYFDVTEGLWDYDVRYELPVNSYDTRLRLRLRDTDSEVIDDDFKSLKIKSESTTYGITIRQPIVRSSNQELWMSLTGERRQSKSFLGGAPFAFLPGTDDAKQVVSVLRFVWDWNWRTPRNVVAIRSTASLGVDVLDATEAADSDAPDSQFFAWLGQIQWAHRLPRRWWGAQTIFRTDVQLVNDPLLSLEKIAVGGMRTVRGYRENEVVRDSAVISSLELRVPLYRSPLGRDIVQLAPFVDVGRAWDERDDLPDETLLGLGIGIRVFPTEWIQGELYWGKDLISVRRFGEHDIQDDGISFRLTVLPFDAFPSL